SKSSAVSNHDVYIAGEVVGVATQMINVVSNYQLLSYPFSCDIGINQMSFTNSASASATPVLSDKLYVWTGTNFVSYGLKFPDRQWHNLKNWNGAPVSDVLKAGQGFWYFAKTNFTWTETNRYLSSF
ncbi:MAG: hypothetical protein PHR35_23080, partial [Kiritimatiellae bacterium]|nr:hypothetical protein [Kiritimatiellia bacterium]